MRIRIIETAVLRMKHKFYFTVFLSILSIICLSCQKEETYYHFHELKNAQWSKYDTLYYDIDSSSILIDIPLDIHIELTNNSDYPYQNIWLYTQDNFSIDSTQMREKQYMLADNMGKWHGAGFGSSYQTSFILQNNFTFTEKRNYRLRIIQGMRDEPLYGIEKVGIKISIARD